MPLQVLHKQKCAEPSERSIKAEIESIAENRSVKEVHKMIRGAIEKNERGIEKQE